MIGNLLRGNPAAVLGLASGQTPRAMYRELIREHRENGLSFRDVTTFNLDEYVGIEPGSPHSYRAYMQRELFDHVDIDTASTFLPECPPGADPRKVGPAYEAHIARVGGIDLQLLGVGVNGHIGFNEPASSLASRTRIKTLTRETIEANRPHFDDPAKQPQLAITMGIASIMDAREILLLATGESKADAVRELCGKQSLTASRGARAVLQIAPAEAMNAFAANSLLKTLEEMPEWGQIVLVASRPVLPTIMSRVQVIEFLPLSDADVARVLLSVGVSPAAVDQLAAISGGSVEQALRFRDAGVQKPTVMSYLDALQRHDRNALVALLPRWSPSAQTLLWRWINEVLCDWPRVFTKEELGVVHKIGVERFYRLIELLREGFSVDTIAYEMWRKK